MKKTVTLLAFLTIMLFVHAQEALQINSKAPYFSATATNGNKLDLKKISSEKSVVLFFYRGQWCPYCNKQMSQLQDSLYLITDLGAKVIAITPEKPEEINKSIEKTKATFDIVYDKDHKIMDLYNVTFALSKTKNALYKTWGIDINEASGNNDYALPVPATYIIKNGKIKGAFFDENYKKRMTVKEIVAALKQH